MSVIIDMDKPERCGICTFRSGARCVMHDALYFDWSDEYANCPLRPAQERERWIPVAERLPENYVLAYSADDGYMCVEAKHKFAAFQITHWMPLPEPPKEE